MRKHVRCFIGLFCACFCICSFFYCGHSLQTYTLSSPDGNLKIVIEKDSLGRVGYRFVGNGVNLIDFSLLGYESTVGPDKQPMQWVVRVQEKSHAGVWKPVWGKRESVIDQYNELTLTLSEDTQSEDKLSYSILFRAYNDGIAFQYQIPEGEKSVCEKSKELTEFNFSDDYTAWFYNGEYHNLGPDKLTQVEGKRYPVMTIQAAQNQYMAIHEAYLQEGDPLVLFSQKGDTRFTVASSPFDLKEGYQSAWRVVLYGTTPGTMVDSHLIELLNPDSKGDFSWVKPGVCVWDWRVNGAKTADGFLYTMTYPTWVRMVDFSAEQGFRSLVLDANWYGPEHESKSNPLTGDKVNDVKRILRYAKQKGVGVWLYLNDVGGRKYPIEKTLKQYGEWGAAGVKYGFMSGTPEEKNHWTKKITALCAQNKLLVDFHDGPVHPYGQMRTWPNAVTREYCQAQLDAHRVFYPSTFVTSVFVNMLAGPIDMNNGMFDLRQGNTTRVDENKPVPSTVVAEAARTLITFSGATIIPDIPEMYRKYPLLLDFISAQKMPWKESKTLMGSIGEYIVMMRETDTDYLVAGATNEQPRTLSVKMDFLPGGSYKAILVKDGEAAHYLTNRETCQSETRIIDAHSTLSVPLAPGGGFCLRIMKEKPM